MTQKGVSSQFWDLIESRGLTRRGFLGFCGTLAVAAGLSEFEAPRVAMAVEESVIGATKGGLYPVIWIEGGSCSGCTESFAQVDTPDPGTVVLEMISLNYSETLSAAAGYSMEQAKEQTIAAGNYVLVYEGAVLKGWDGNALRVAGQPGLKHLEEAAANAKAVIALGSCAVNGGWCAGNPNSANACGVQQYLGEVGISTPVVNIPGCPANPEWLVSVLVDALMLDGLNDLSAFDLNAQNKPNGIFGQTIHDNCERRGHFENGEFVYEFGSEEEAKGYCLYPLGCRGPQTYSNCGVTRWNHGRSWCVASGAPCIGCCTANPANPAENWLDTNTPFRERHHDVQIGDATVQPGVVAGVATAAVAAALGVHAIGMKVSGRMDGGAPFETIRQWDMKHPDKAIGQYEDIQSVIEQAKEEKDAKKKGGE